MISRLKPEWQTILLAVLIYALFGFVTWNYHSFPGWFVFIIGGYVVAWHGSLRHEAVHMHPTTSNQLNELLVLPSLDLYLPFRLYAQTHIKHHINQNLTDPELDPESFYLFEKRWNTLPLVRQWSYWIFHTLAGRLLLYPFWMIPYFWFDEALNLARGDIRNLQAWIWHLLGITLTMSWAIGACGIPLWEYLLLFVYPGTSLTLLRSFAEHRSHPDCEGRSAILETGNFFGILYLYNNYHALHHNNPQVPWYKLPMLFLQEREKLLERNGNYLIRGYSELFRKNLVSPKEIPYLLSK